MQPLMRLALSAEGYENYLLASGRTNNKTTARLSHLLIANIHGVGVAYLAYATFTNSKFLIDAPQTVYYAYKPPFWPLYSPYVDPWLNYKAGLLTSSMIALSSVTFKTRNWDRFKRNVRGVWDPVKVAREDYQRELSLVLPELIMKIAVVAAAFLIGTTMPIRPF